MTMDTEHTNGNRRLSPKLQCPSELFSMQLVENPRIPPKEMPNELTVSFI